MAQQVTLSTNVKELLRSTFTTEATGAITIRLESGLGGLLASITFLGAAWTNTTSGSQRGATLDDAPFTMTPTADGTVGRMVIRDTSGNDLLHATTGSGVFTMSDLDVVNGTDVEITSVAIVDFGGEDFTSSAVYTKQTHLSTEQAIDLLAEWTAGGASIELRNASDTAVVTFTAGTHFTAGSNVTGLTAAAIAADATSAGGGPITKVVYVSGTNGDLFEQPMSATAGASEFSLANLSPASGANVRLTGTHTVTL